MNVCCPLKHRKAGRKGIISLYLTFVHPVQNIVPGSSWNQNFEIKVTNTIHCLDLKSCPKFSIPDSTPSPKFLFLSTITSDVFP